VGCKVIAHQRAVLPLSRGAMDETIAPVNRRMALVLALFRLYHRAFTFPPLALSEKDRLVTGDDFDILRSAT
jgi:hypothetical protein